MTDWSNWFGTKLVFKIVFILKRFLGINTAVLFSFLIFLNLQFSFAIEITEIMYDPEGSDTDTEWIEVFNDEGASLDLSNYKLFESNSNHSINAYQGSPILAPGEFALIVDDGATIASKYSSTTLKILDSSFSLSNSGESVSLKDSNGNVIKSATFTPVNEANGTGGSLNHVIGEWKAYVATPGEETKNVTPTISSGSVTSGDTNSGTTGSNYSSGYTSKTYRLGDLNLLVPKEIYGLTGAATQFFVKVLDSKGNTLNNVNIFWSYGDGMEGINSTSSHIYKSSGDYTVLVEAENGSKYGVERIKVKIDDPKIYILKVSTSTLVIQNDSDDELDIGGFVIWSDQGIFKLSRKLILHPRSTLNIDGTLFENKNLTNVKLMNSLMQKINYKENANQFTDTNTNLFQNNLKSSDDILVSSTINLRLRKIKSTSTVLEVNKLRNTSSQNTISRSNANPTKNSLNSTSSTSKILTASTNTIEINNTNIVDEAVKQSNSKTFLQKWFKWIYD